MNDGWTRASDKLPPIKWTDEERRHKRATRRVLVMLRGRVEIAYFVRDTMHRYTYFMLSSGTHVDARWWRNNPEPPDEFRGVADE